MRSSQFGMLTTTLLIFTPAVENHIKSEIRISKHETISKFEIQMLKTARLGFRVLVIRICFEFRASVFELPPIKGATCAFDAKFWVILTGLTGLTCCQICSKKILENFVFCL